MHSVRFITTLLEAKQCGPFGQTDQLAPMTNTKEHTGRCNYYNMRRDRFDQTGLQLNETRPVEWDGTCYASRTATKLCCGESYIDSQKWNCPLKAFYLCGRPVQSCLVYCGRSILKYQIVPLYQLMIGHLSGLVGCVIRSLVEQRSGMFTCVQVYRQVALPLVHRSHQARNQFIMAPNSGPPLLRSNTCV